LPTPSPTAKPIHPDARIGHVHLKVADLQRALEFYCGVLGFEPGSTGLFHLAILYPTRLALADALARLVRAGVPLDGASDHGVSEALYLRDPDQNGVELYWDRPEQEWPRDPDGKLHMVTERLDVQGLLAELER
jgi:catechol 2,3-dioxygenase